MIVKNILKFHKNICISKSFENWYDPLSDFFFSKTVVENIHKLQIGHKYNTFPYIYLINTVSTYT